jgi:hypothetical protein
MLLIYDSAGSGNPSNLSERREAKQGGLAPGADALNFPIGGTRARLDVTELLTGEPEPGTDVLRKHSLSIAAAANVALDASGPPSRIACPVRNRHARLCDRRSVGAMRR